jgi:hypothetical protein
MNLSTPMDDGEIDALVAAFEGALADVAPDLAADAT